MDVPSELEAAAGTRDNVAVTTRAYDEETVIAVDFGPIAGDLTLDIVGETAIVVADGTQLEFEIPTDADGVTVNDGILTIRSETTR